VAQQGFPNISDTTVSDTEVKDRDLEALKEALGEDFDVVRTLGKGAVATVYLAKDRSLGRLVAIKVMNPGKVADETARRRFEREAKAAASLSEHANVVAVHRFGRLPDETPYLVMHFVKGRTLEERLKAEGRLPLAQALLVLQGVASALELAHSRGIVHRDVRPGNVLWDEEHEKALLTDFGIAAILATSGEDVARLTQTGQLLGDPRYLSPEQLLDQDLTELADIYGLGIMGYELLTGEGPYDARSNTEWITAHLSKEPKDLQHLRPDVPKAITDLLQRCLAREPNHRPAASDVSRILRSGGERAVPPGTVTSVEEPADLQMLLRKRVPQLILIVATAGMGLLAVTDMLADRGILSDVAFQVVLTLVVGGVLSSTIVAWFHGERGKQAAPFIEYLLLSLVGVATLMISGWILLSG
jgi:serine/threonine-protein kinase